MERSQRYLCPSCGWGTTLQPKADVSTEEFQLNLKESVPCGNKDQNCKDYAVKQRYIVKEVKDAAD